MAIALVLFDLDGTLLDTAADLGVALNALRAEHGLAPLTAQLIRPVVSHGSPALLQLGLDVTPEDPRFAGLRERFLRLYRERLTAATRFFPGMPAVLDALERRRLRWGVVTNKPQALAAPLLAHFGLAARTACLVGGDSTARRKPHPDPLLHACALCGSAPAASVYVGDAAHDIEAARAAGMHAAVARYGYIDAAEFPESWGADALLDTPLELLAWLDRMGTMVEARS